MFDRVLIALDESKPLEPMLAAAMSVTHPRHTRVSVLTVRERPQGGSEDGSGGGLARLRPAAGDASSAAADRLRHAGYQADASIHLVQPGGTADEIIRAIDDMGPDLVVMGSRGLTDLRALVSGSISHRVLAEAGCPVLVVREDAHLESPRRLLVAYDDSHHSRRAARVAADLARSTGAEIEVVLVKRPLLAEAALVVDSAGSQRLIDDLIETVCPDVVASASVKVAAAGKAACIAETAEQSDADLIVMGTRGLSRIAGAAIGSVSHEVIHLSHRQVLLVP
jgi:nucleotide-binding universal stress UspA family protein